MLAILSTLSDYTGSILSTMIVGGKFSTVGLVVVGVITPIINVQIFVCDMLCAIAVYLRSVYISEGDEDRGARVVGTATLIVTLVGLLLGAVMFFFPETYVSFYNLKAQTAVEAVKYVRASALYPLCAILAYEAYEFIFRMNKKIPCGIIIFMCSGGIFILGLVLTNMFGIVGMAYANVITMAVNALIGIVTMLGDKRDLRFSFVFKKEEFKELLQYGFSYSQDTFYSPIYNAVLMAFMGHFLGESCIAVFTVVICVTDICSVFYGISYASQNQLSIYLGEKNDDGIRRTLGISIKFQAALAVVVTALVLIFAEPIALYFGMEEQYHNETIFAIKVFALSFIFLALVSFLCDFYTCCEKFAASICLFFTKSIIAGLGVTILLGYIMGSKGIYIGKALEAPITLLVTYIFVCKKYKTKSIFIVDTKNDDIVTYEYPITIEEIVRVRDAAEAELKKRGASADVINKVQLAIEEVSVMTKDQNDKLVYGETCMIFRDGGVELIIRDSGKIRDLSDTDTPVTSLRSITLSNIAKAYPYTRHINASNTNRMTYRFEL